MGRPTTTKFSLAFALAAAAALGSACSSSGRGSRSDASTTTDTGTSPTADATTEPDAGPSTDAKGYGCGCATDEDCAGLGFCGTFGVCTSNETLECTTSADCFCGAVCVEVNDTRSCQNPCGTTADCPGTLECGAPPIPWTTTEGQSLEIACRLPTAPVTVNWTNDIGPLVAARCAGCHTGGGASGGVSFDTFAATQAQKGGCGLADGQTRKIAETMALKVSPNPPCGSRMPLSGGPLTDGEVKLFSDWVAAGTPE